MLVLSRKLGEAIQIGPDVVVRVVRMDGQAVRLAIEAPSSVRIFRAEVYGQIAGGNQGALVTNSQEVWNKVRQFQQQSAAETPPPKPPPLVP